MTRLKFFIVTLLACCTMSVSAHDAYQQAVEKYMSVSGDNLAKEKMAEGLAKSCEKLGKSEADCKAFVENEFYPLFVTSMTEAFKKEGVTTEDLAAVTAAMQSSEGKKALEDTKKIATDDGIQKVGATIMPVIKQLVQGQEPQPFPVPEVSDSYRQKFHTYSTAYKVDRSIMQITESMKGSLGNNPDVQEKFNKVMTYLSSNIENLMISIYKDNLTEADLDFYCNLLATPSGAKVNAATNNAMVAFAPKMMESMKKFMDKKK